MLNQIYEKMDADIERTGRSCLHVFGDSGVPPFTYTIGNAYKGLPEVLVVGLGGADAMWLCNAFSELMIERGGVPQDSELVDMGGACKVKIVHCRPEVKRDFTIQAGRYMRREDYEVVQVVVPDPKGRFPGEPGCEQPYADVPVMRPFDA